MLAGFLIAAAIIGFIADVLSLWPRIRPFFKKNLFAASIASKPITLNIGRIPPARFKKIDGRCTKSKNETRALSDRRSSKKSPELVLPGTAVVGLGGVGAGVLEWLAEANLNRLHIIDSERITKEDLALAVS